MEDTPTALSRQKNDVAELERESKRFREKRGEGVVFTEEEVEEERRRRKLISVLGGKRDRYGARGGGGRYEGDPRWDDVVPVEQEDGEGALAQIAYSGEYCEGMFFSSFLLVFLGSGGGG